MSEYGITTYNDNKNSMLLTARSINELKNSNKYGRANQLPHTSVDLPGDIGEHATNPIMIPDVVDMAVNSERNAGALLQTVADSMNGPIQDAIGRTGYEFDNDAFDVLAVESTTTYNDQAFFRGPSTARNRITPAYGMFWFDTNEGQLYSCKSGSSSWRKHCGVEYLRINYWDEKDSPVYSDTNTKTIHTPISHNENIMLTSQYSGSTHCFISGHVTSRDYSSTDVKVKVTQFHTSSSLTMYYYWEIRKD